eukprot:Skav230857  [mRNA]  locus=scaffold3471:416314:418123:- [translate_table: standard]
MSRCSETTMLPSSLTQVGFSGLATVEMRAPHILRGIHVERRRERMLGCCRCVSANCDNRPFQAWQFRAEPEMLCRRCNMKPAPANIYSPEVMAALKSRGGATGMTVNDCHGMSWLFVTFWIVFDTS